MNDIHANRQCRYLTISFFLLLPADSLFKDDVIDDFMFKKMGNGEVFFTAKENQSSGRENTEGTYNGMGIRQSEDWMSPGNENYMEERRRKFLEEER
jgi:hypothetical protein